MNDTPPAKELLKRTCRCCHAAIHHLAQALTRREMILPASQSGIFLVPNGEPSRMEGIGNTANWGCLSVCPASAQV